MHVGSSHHSIPEETPATEPEAQSHNTIQQAAPQEPPAEDQEMHEPALHDLGYGELHAQGTEHSHQGSNHAETSGPATPSSSSKNLTQPTTISQGFSREDLDDPSEYHPLDTLRKRNQQETTGEANYPLEQAAPSAAAKGKGNSITHQLPSGPVNSRFGHGGAPFVTSKKDNYDGAQVAVDYDDIAKKLNHSNPQRQENMAQAMLKMTKGEKPSLKSYTTQEKRAMSHLAGITQLAEQHPNRTPGSAALARASLQRIADGTSTFHQEFNTKDGNYVPARKAVKTGPDKAPGGTQQMRDFVRGTKTYEEAEHTAANLSESEDEPMSDGEDDRMNVDHTHS